MTSETESLQNRAAELSAALEAQESSRNETSCLLQAQEEHRKAILQSEELTRNSIQRIYDFVTIFKSAPS
ncbi:hypothetical protein C0J52_20705 [Blattella germanica]|nr:hypothetical protein C0J52_20705 [Blattella germanica]